MDFSEGQKVLQGTAFLLWCIPLCYYLTRTPRSFYGLNVVPGRVQNFLVISAALLNVCHSYSESAIFIVVCQLLGVGVVYAVHKNLRGSGLALSTRGMIRGEYTADEIIEGAKLRGAFMAVGKQEVPYQFRLSSSEKTARNWIRLCGTIVGLPLLIIGGYCASELGGWLALFNLGLVILFGAWSTVMYPFSALFHPGSEE